MKVWDDLLSEHDQKCLANRPRGERKPQEPGDNPALLVIDMQLGVIGEDRPIYEQQDKYPAACGSSAWKAIRYLQELIPSAREAGISVVYSRNIIRPEAGLTVSPNSPFNPENPTSEIIKELAPQKGDMYIEKNRASIFFHTPVVYTLYNKKVDTLLITGNTTSGCIRASAIDGAGYGFKVFVIEDCIFDRLEISHKASLLDLWYKYCDVISIDETYKYIDKIKTKRQ